MGRIKRPIGTDDDDFFRCRRCGFPCNLTRDKIGPGSGLTFTDVTDSASDEPTVTSPGCPFCGCRNYRNWQR